MIVKDTVLLESSFQWLIYFCHLCKDPRTKPVELKFLDDWCKFQILLLISIDFLQMLLGECGNVIIYLILFTCICLWFYNPWAGNKNGNVDLSKWSKDDFSTCLIPDYIDCKYFAGKPVATNNFGLCFAAKEKFYRHFLATTFFHLATEKKKCRLPIGACRKS